MTKQNAIMIRTVSEIPEKTLRQLEKEILVRNPKGDYVVTNFFNFKILHFRSHVIQLSNLPYLFEFPTQAKGSLADRA